MAVANPVLGRRELRLLIVGAFLIAIALPVTMLVIPQAKKLGQARTAVDALESVSVNADMLVDALSEARLANDELRLQLYGKTADLPPNQMEAFIIGRLQEVSWAAEVDLRSVEPFAGASVQIYEESLFRIEIAGRYVDLYDWLWAVRRDLGYVVVKHYDLRRLDNSDEDPVLLADLSLAVYRAVQE